MGTGLMRVRSEDGEMAVVIEVDDREPGFHPVGRKEAIAEAKKRFEEGLAEVKDAAKRALDTFRGGDLSPDGVELEFGVRFNAEIGAVVAKTTAEGHLIVRLTWSADPGQPGP